MKIRDVKKRIVTCVVFFVLYCLSFVFISYLMRPITTSRKNICGFYAEEKDSLDVVFVGGSVCYASWEPLAAWNQYGFTSYNFATDALSPHVIKYILAEIQKTQSPEVYVIDLRPFQYGNLIGEQENVPNMERVAPFRNLADNMKYSVNRIALIKNCAPGQEAAWTYYFDISKYHSGLYTLLNGENWKYIFNERYLYSKGHSPLCEINPIFFSDTRAIDEELPLEGEVNESFLDLLEYCGQNDLNVLFLVYPYGNSETDQKKYNYMEHRIEEYGFRFINTNEYFGEIGLDQTKDFCDFDHLNLLGADKFSDFFSEYLEKEYLFKDKRNDLHYEQWNRDYVRWWEETEIIRDILRD